MNKKQIDLQETLEGHFCFLLFIKQKLQKMTMSSVCFIHFIPPPFFHKFLVCDDPG